MDEEKRRERRLPFRGCTARVGGAGLPLRVVDLSTAGIQVLSEAPLAPGREVRIDLVTPQFSRPIRLEGRVAWTRPAEEGGDGHRIGIEFRDLDRKARAMLEELKDEGLHREIRPRRP